MNIYWVYVLPTWLFGILTIAVFVLTGVGGMFATRKWARGLHFEDHSHNDIVGFFLGAVTVSYGVTLGLMSVGAWTTHTDAEMKVAQEAASLAALYRDVSSYPVERRTELQDDLRHYTREVIDVAWPAQRKGVIPSGGTELLDAFQKKIAVFEPSSEGQKILHAETYREYDRLVEFRRMRLQSVNGGLSAALWFMLLGGAFVCIAITWFFSIRNRSMHFWMTVSLSALLGLLIFELATIDNPFRGDMSVSPDAFVAVYEQLMKPGG
jgi:Protein of unknown function (DUF4239)